MRSYYGEVSYGGLDVTGEVYGKARSQPSEWVDWIRAPKRYSWYTAGDNGFGRYPRNAQRLTEDAVAAADPYVDFSAFTTRQTTQGGVSGTFVSALFVVHAGPGAEVTGSKNDI
jgi:immune inhibitor A